jgi:NAD(P)-dependent dehydrogenase (short-subunit alcohol dehydrogenase family)
MDYNLEGKLAFITGSAKGIGKATAALLLREGAEVIIHGRTRDSVERAKKDLSSAHTVYGDLHKKGEVAKIVEDVKNIGTVQILVNNAGIYEAKAFQDITDEDWLRFFEVNVMSGVRFSRALLPPMLLLNWGRIIFVSSESAINIPKEMIHYGTTKTAQLAVSRGLAELTKGTEVTVNTVAPGRRRPRASSISSKASPPPRVKIRKRLRTISLERCAQPRCCSASKTRWKSRKPSFSLRALCRAPSMAPCSEPMAAS